MHLGVSNTVWTSQFRQPLGLGEGLGQVEAQFDFQLHIPERAFRSARAAP